MKKLFLLRHAKSSWDDERLADFDRPLNERGKKAAPFMGKVIRDKKLKPDLILCSPAKRTKQTAKLVLEASELNKSSLTYEQRIYEASAAELLNVLKAQDGDVGSIMMIGHNPGMSDLLAELTGVYEHFPTAALANIELKIDHWSGIESGAGELTWILRPKELS